MNCVLPRVAGGSIARLGQHPRPIHSRPLPTSILSSGILHPPKLPTNRSGTPDPTPSNRLVSRPLQFLDLTASSRRVALEYIESRSGWRDGVEPESAPCEDRRPLVLAT